MNDSYDQILVVYGFDMLLRESFQFWKPGRIKNEVNGLCYSVLFQLPYRKVKIDLRTVEFRHM